MKVVQEIYLGDFITDFIKAYIPFKTELYIVCFRSQDKHIKIDSSGNVQLLIQDQSRKGLYCFFEDYIFLYHVDGAKNDCVWVDTEDDTQENKLFTLFMIELFKKYL